MGYFTWNFADTGECMGYDGFDKPIYLLVPKEFGENIAFSYYDGYGRIGGHDVYELVADWNRESLTDEFINTLSWGRNLIRIFRDGGEQAAKDYIFEKFPEENWLRTDWKRNIGISIACEDRDHARVRYPIRFSTRNVPYESLEGFSSSTQ